MKNLDQIVEDGLRREPDFKLGADFKDRVVKLIKRKERLAQRKFYTLITIGAVLMFGGAIWTVLRFADLEAFSMLNQIVPIAVVIGSLVALIQYLDKKLVKDKMFKQLV